MEASGWKAANPATNFTVHVKSAAEVRSESPVGAARQAALRDTAVAAIEGTPSPFI
jgi:hypothetical protein